MQSRVLYDGPHYTACAMADGSLVVTRKRKRGGVQLTGPQASQWIAAIADADDSSEANALCRAVLNSAG